MGRIRTYSIIIPKSERRYWLDQGWKEVRGFYNYHYFPARNETVMLSIPQKITVHPLNFLIGRTIENYSTSFGTYGMGGPGFFGLILSNRTDTDPHGGRDVLVYAVDHAGGYALLDGRVIECGPLHYDTVHPWVSRFAELPQWDDLTLVLLDCTITDIQLTTDRCILTLADCNSQHTLEFLKNDSRLPPFGGGSPRTDAFETGEIGDYLVYQKEHALLHV
jgi:hypothetical protein